MYFDDTIGVNHSMWMVAESHGEKRLLFQNTENEVIFSW